MIESLANREDVLCVLLSICAHSTSNVHHIMADYPAEMRNTPLHLAAVAFSEELDALENRVRVKLKQAHLNATSGGYDEHFV